MKDSFSIKSSKLIFSIYIYYSNLLLGWQLASFVYLYHTTDPGEILTRLIRWYEFQLVMIAVGALITVLILIIHRLSPISLLQHIQGLPKQLILQTVFLVYLFIIYLTVKLDIHLQAFELVSVLMAIWMLKRWASIFYHSKIEAWRHPTTFGMHFVSGLLIGFSLLSILEPVGMAAINIKLILVILLIFELLIIFARFQFLSKSGEVTRRIAKNLMASKLLWFGSRIIIGIFMPGIFILYMILINGTDIQGVELLILCGTLLDKWLFINSANVL